MLGNVCVFPTQSELNEIVSVLQSSPVSPTSYLPAVSVVSIGAGCGLLEGLLQQAGITVTAVDLDHRGSLEAYATQPCFIDIVRISPNHIYRLQTAQLVNCALMFVYGRPTVPFKVYRQSSKFDYTYFLCCQANIMHVLPFPAQEFPHYIMQIYTCTHPHLYILQTAKSFLYLDFC